MAKIRVYELARDLNMTNKVLLDKMESMQIVVKSHMSSIDQETVDRIKLFVRTGSKDANKVEEKRIRPTVIRRRKKVTVPKTPEPLQTEQLSESDQDVPEHVSQPPLKEPVETESERLEKEPIVEETTKETIPEPKPEPAAPPPKEDAAKIHKKKKVPVTEERAKIISKPEPIQPIDTPVDDIPAADTPVDDTPADDTPVDDQSVAETAEQPPSSAKEPIEPDITEKEKKAATEMPSTVKPIPKDVSTPVETVDDSKPKTLPTEERKVAPKKAKAKKTKKHVAAKIIKLPDKPPVTPIAQKDEPKDRVVRDNEEQKKPLPGQAEEKEEKARKDAKKHKKKKKRGDEQNGFQTEEDKKFLKKKISFRKKSVVEGKALYEDGPTRARKMRKGAKTKQVVGEKPQITTPKAIKRRIRIDETIALSDLAKRMGIKANEMIQKLMSLGVMATVNQTIDYDTAVLVAAEFNYEVEKATFEEDALIKKIMDDPEKMIEKPPVVTIMGHVDHGKTSLLDVIRKTNVTGMEAGGITQHIGAYSVQTEKGQITFLDTPGHEAFTAMRARGSLVTDIVVLVVAADDGVMPQTVEAINHSKAAKVPIIVAVNKIDKPDADPERVKRELSEHGIVAEDWGGDVILANVSAKQKKGINNLLDMILLQSEMLELKANPDKLARGYVVESKLDIGRGPVATVLVQEGTLKTGESIVCGLHYGKIRAMLNDKGKIIDTAGPAIPVEVIGLSGVPEAGDELIALDDEKNAKQVSANRTQKQRAKELAQSSRLSLEGLYERLEEGEIKELNLIIKADVHGSIEALKDSLTKLSSDEVKINVIHAATGAVNESDIPLAAASNAIILGFNVRPGAKVLDLAAEENVDIRFYDIIYNAIKDIKDAMVGMMASTFEEQLLGRAEVRELFVIPKKGTIAGSYVTDGKIERGKRIRVVRDGIVVYDGQIGSLRRFKDDVKDVQSGYECGIGVENFNDLKMGDILECYHLDEIKPTLA